MKRIGIKRRFLPGFKWYTVKEFWFRTSVDAYDNTQKKIEHQLSSLWLVMQLENDYALIIPDIEKRGYIVELPKLVGREINGSEESTAVASRRDHAVSRVDPIDRVDSADGATGSGEGEGERGSPSKDAL